LPDVLDWYLARIFGQSGMIRSRVRRNIERTLSINAPSDRVLTSVSDLTSQLSGFRSTLEHAVTTARIVVTPEHLVLAEGQRTMSYLALYGYPVDAVLVNRVLGGELGSPLLETWHANQAQQLKRIDEAFSPLPQAHAQLRPSEPIGFKDLAEVGLELYGDVDPLERMSTQGAVTITSDGPNAVVRIPVSGIERGAISVEREGTELTIGLGTHRRVIALPDAFANQQVLRAGVNHEILEVVFTGADHA
jgi:arsenite-transporting ATPase